MKPFLKSTVTRAAEKALREAIAHADPPLDRLQALAHELSAAFLGAAADAATNGDAIRIAEMAEEFRVACERIWIELGGDPARMPDIEIALDRDPEPLPWRAHQFQQ